MRLTDHFTLQELTRSQTAERNGWNNQPSSTSLTNLKETAWRMEAVRAVLNTPVYVSSGYRSPKLNQAIGGSKTSHHCKGYAVDFTAPAHGTPQDVVRTIKKSGVKYDQLIYEGSWVHISFAPSMRRQTLTAIFKNGVSYKQF